MIAEILLAHAVGDYLIQSDWMAVRKTKQWWPAIVHGVTYTLPFLLVTTSLEALAVIAGTHVVIDRYRLARYFIWVRNWMSPVRVRRGDRVMGEARFLVDAYNPPWRDCRTTGFAPNRPAWLTVWLLFITDNILHILLNLAAIKWLG